MPEIANKQKPQTVYDRLFRYAEFLGFGELHMKIDQATGLRAIIAIHDTTLGPALGGCRCIPYHSTDEALKDALRLAQMMSYKAAVCGLPHGGAKAVLMRPKTFKDRQAYFGAFGRFVHSLNGKYITAVDSGTEPSDMDTIAQYTPYVTCTTKDHNLSGDPSPYTALGVRRGIEAAVKHKLNKATLKDVHVAIQGAGHVGYYLARELNQLGARITMADINKVALQRCVTEFGVAKVAPEYIYQIPCDVFAPCALGAILNLDTIKQLQTSIVAGSANNQLAHRHHGVLMHEKGILYAPDFVINAGGLIHAAAIYDHGNEDKAHQQIYNLYNTLLQLFERASEEQRPTNEIAEIIARENLSSVKLNP